MTLNDHSIQKLEGVHPDLVKVVLRAAAKGATFIVTEGLRSRERQTVLVAAGKSKTLHSRHLTGHAVDLAIIVDGEVSWRWPAYKLLAAMMKVSARELDTSLEWGGDWVSWKDGPHFQLPWAEYPGGEDIFTPEPRSIA